MLQDKRGFLWFATDDGLNRYDGHAFKIYEQGKDSTSLLSDNVRCILESRTGKIWIGTIHGGLHRFDPETDCFQRLGHITQGKYDNNVHRLYEDKDTLLWVGTYEGLKCYDPVEERIVPLIRPGNNALPFDTIIITALLIDKEGMLWIGTKNGLNRYEPRTGENMLFKTNAADNKSISHNDISTVIQDKYGQIWIGTLGGGLNRYVEGDGFIHYRHESGNPNTPGSDRIQNLLEGDGPMIWIGTRNDGLDLFNSQAKTFEHHIHDPDDPQSIGAETLWWIIEDASGILWIAQNGTISKLDPLKSAFVNHRHKMNDPYSLSLNTVTAMDATENGAVWIGTWGEGLNQYDLQTDLFKSFRHEPGNPNSLADDRVRYIHAANENRLWISTYSGKVNLFDGKNFILFTHNPDDPNRVGNGAVGFVAEDDEQNAWLGDRNGLTRINLLSGDFKHFYSGSDISSGSLLGILIGRNGRIWVNGTAGLHLYNQDREVFEDVDVPEGKTAEITATHEDKNGALWLGVAGLGLVKYQPDSGSTVTYGKEEGLTNYGIDCILQDSRSRLWLGTDKGLFCFDESERKFTAYFRKDGLPDDAFFLSSCCQSKATGRLYFGGVKGFVEFHPDSVRANIFEPPVVIHAMQRYEEGIGSTEVSLIGKKEVALSYRDQLIAFQFAALDFHDPSENQYQYKLEGLNQEWISLGTKNEITISKLDPGDYTLRVRGSNSQGRFSSDEAVLRISIAPPWHRTGWANSLWATLLIGSLFALYRFQLNRKLAQAEAQRLKDLDAVKTRLYTNITHEFRTPLTVILGMADQITDNPREWLGEGMQLIRRYGRQLLHLVNQLLDLAKLESDSLPVNKVQGDIVEYLQYVTESFQSYAESRNISLHFLPEAGELVMDYDPEKMLNIVSNLLSNAIKFTPPGGNIYFQVEESIQNTGSCLRITVKDSGIGISADQLPHVFSRFYQVDASATRQNEGTGIGLALTKELVILLDGTIEVSSKACKGATFTVLLPVAREAQTAAPPGNLSELKPMLAPFAEEAARKETWENLEVNPTGSHKPLLLIIEDNRDVVRYLIACLEPSYQLATAENGKTGIEKALELVPDIIISDVMMPEKDGFEVCDTLKNDERTSHIPLVLLTARSDVASKIAGLKRGADAYLPKPFNKEELLAQLENLIEQRRKLQQRYQGALPKPSPDHADTEIEDAFLQKIRALVEANMAKADFDISWLAREANMSRVQLFRKVKALTDKSPSLFVRSIRLQKAKALLLATDQNISEVAYDVGFSDPAFFSRAFREEFGQSPTEVREG